MIGLFWLTQTYLGTFGGKLLVAAGAQHYKSTAAPPFQPSQPDSSTLPLDGSKPWLSFDKTKVRHIVESLIIYDMQKWGSNTTTTQ
jgi:hypothetical protein